MDAHPDHRMEYTAKLDMARMNKSPRLRLIRGLGMGRGVHKRRAVIKARAGAITYRVVVEVAGFEGSLVNSFIASAKGCSNP